MWNIESLTINIEIYMGDTDIFQSELQNIDSTK